MTERKGLSRFHVIILNLLLVALPFALYFLVYVDAQRARIATRQFQVLNDVGTELSEAITALAAAAFRGEKSKEKIRALRKLSEYRNLRLEGGAGVSWSQRDPSLEIVKERGRSLLRLAGWRWEWGKGGRSWRVGSAAVLVPLGDLVAGDRPLEFFDELLIVDGSGRVRFRRGAIAVHLEDLHDLASRVRASRTMRVANEAAAKARPEGGGATESGGLGEPFMETLSLGEVDYLVFGQPWRPPFAAPPRSDHAGARQDPNGTWTIVGIARTAQFYSEVTRVREIFLAAAIASLVFGALSWPWVKLWLIGPREKLRPIDAQLVCLSLVFGLAVVTLCLCAAAAYRAARSNIDELHEEVARGLSRAAVAELAEVRELLKGTARAGHDRSCIFPDFDAAFAVDARWGAQDGESVGDRNPKIRPGWVGDRSYFQRAKRGEINVVERIRGRATGGKLAVFAVQSDGAAKEVAPSCKSQECFVRRLRKENAIVVLTRRMFSLQNAVLPIGFGFAVVDQRKDVVFHSDDERSLLENFWATAHHDAAVGAAIGDGRKTWVDADYAGRPHRMYFQPLRQDGVAAPEVNCLAAPGETLCFKELADPAPGWTLVVFRELHVLDRVLSRTLLASAATLLAYLFALAVAISWVRAAIGRDAFWAWVWPQPGFERRYAGLAVALAGLLAVGILAVNEVAGNPQAGWHVTLLALVASPVLAISLGLEALGNPHGHFRRRSLIARIGLVAGSAGVVYLLRWIYIADSALHLPVIAAGLVLTLASAVAIGAPTSEPRPGRIAGAEYLVIALLGLLVVAAVPAVILFRDAFVLEVDSLQTLEHRRLRISSQARADSLVQYYRSLTGGGADVDLSSIRDDYAYRRGVFAGVVGVATRRPDQLACWVRGALLGFDLPGESCHQLDAPKKMLTADFMADGSWWLPDSTGDRIGLALSVALALGVGIQLLRSAAIRILGYDFPRERTSRLPSADEAVNILIKRVQESPRSASSLLIAPPPSAARTLRDGLAGALGEDEVAWVKLPLKHANELLEYPFSRRLSPSPKVVVVEHFETAMLNTRLRAALLSLLEDARIRKGIPVILISEAFQLRQVFTPEPSNKEPNDAARSEVLRWTDLLATFHKQSFFREVDDRKRAALLRPVLRDECRSSESLLEIAAELEADGTIDATIDDEAVVELLAERAEAYYERVWSLCTRQEKLLMIHLARGYLVNPRNVEVLEHLTRRGLVRSDAGFRLMNRSFARFVARAESEAVVEGWEQDSREGLWQALRWSVLSLLGVGGVLVTYLGLDAVNPVFALVPLVASAVPGLPRLVSVFSTAKGHGASVA